MRSRKHSSHVTPFLRKYKFELTVGVLGALGVFLLWENLYIKKTVWRGVEWIAAGFVSFLGLVGRTLRDIETSDVVGLILILVAAGLIAIRIRGKIIARHSGRYECQHCAGRLVRHSRGLGHRLLGLILLAKIRPCTCTKCQQRVFVMKRGKSAVSRFISKFERF